LLICQVPNPSNGMRPVVKGAVGSA
jgi:hypothetical protein